MAAIAAAALAAIAVLPALLGGSEPPPLPADVGLAPTATPKLPPITDLAPAVEQPPAKLLPRRRRTDPARGERPADRAVHPRHHSRRNRGEKGPAPASTPTLSPPVYVYPVTPAPPEFGFER